MPPFYERCSTASRLGPFQGGSLLFTTKFPEIPGTHFMDLRRMKGWVDLGATQWFWIQDPKIGNPAPLPLGHCFMNSANTKKKTISAFIKTLHMKLLPLSREKWFIMKHLSNIVPLKMKFPLTLNVLYHQQIIMFAAGSMSEATLNLIKTHAKKSAKPKLAQLDICHHLKLFMILLKRSTRIAFPVSTS